MMMMIDARTRHVNVCVWLVCLMRIVHKGVMDVIEALSWSLASPALMARQVYALTSSYCHYLSRTVVA